MGKHIDTIPLNERVTLLKVRIIKSYSYMLRPPVFITPIKLVYAFGALYFTTAGIIKISVLLMYRRIFPVRLITIGGSILGGMTIVWVFAGILVAIFQCRPVSKGWDSAEPGHCIELNGVLIGNGAVNFIIDIFILALPTRLIWQLQASIWRRISVLCMFLTGSL